MGTKYKNKLKEFMKGNFGKKQRKGLSYLPYNRFLKAERMFDMS